MSEWRLGIDFGTSATVAAVARDGVAHVVDIESNGSSRLPSSVYLTEDDEILVGTAAIHQAVFGPERFEPTPKRAFGEGEIFLGDHLVPVTELAAAVFRRVYTETCRQQGETTPCAVRITHPADWSEARIGVLREAVEKAGISSSTLIPEPVAAAVRIASETAPGRRIGVYDFGGGTFDAAVLHRTSDTFVVAGPPAGRDPLGGEDIDQRIITYIGTIVGESSDAWLSVTNPADVASRRNASGLRAEVQRAKETLSEVSACQLWIPGVERDIQLTRAELEQLIAPDIDATVDTLETAFSDAGVAAKDLAGLYLVGGSSRIPLVATVIWRRLGVRPAVQDNPKSVVALGAAGWLDTPTIARDVRFPIPLPEKPPAPPDKPFVLLEQPADAAGQFRFRSYVAADVSRTPWAAGSEGSSQLIVSRAGPIPSTIRARDAPTTARWTLELAQLTQAHRAARTPGYRELSTRGARVFGQVGGIERRFVMAAGGRELTMVERYLVLEGRAFVLACPETDLPVADAFVLGKPPPAGLYASRFEFPCPPGWTPDEQLLVRRNGTSHSILAQHTRLPQPVTTGAWLSYCLSQLQQRLEEPSTVGHFHGRVLADLDGDIVAVRSTNRGSPILTKLGVAVSGQDAFAISISLPHREQNQFTSLARQVCLSPSVVGSPA